MKTKVFAILTLFTMSFLTYSCAPQVIETHEVVIVKPKPKPQPKPKPDNPEGFRAVESNN